MKKLGRNDPCHCGSRKKYKKCHLPIERLLPAAIEKMRQQQLKQLHYEARYGKARPMMGTDFNGHKLIVEGNKIHFRQDVRTPADFLDKYLKEMFGKELWKEESGKDPSKQHPIVRWHFRKCEQLKSIPREADGLCKAPITWPSWQYFGLARDLHMIRDHMAYQKKVLSFLRTHDHFAGIRNELFAAATFIRAGFEINWEDTKGRGGKRPVEFNADSKELKERVAVESKAANKVSTAPNINSLLSDAFGKTTELPLVIFLDVSVPPFVGSMHGQPWWHDLQEACQSKASLNGSGKSKYSLMVVTNFWADPGDDEKTDFYQEFTYVLPANPVVPFRNPSTVDVIIRSVQQFGLVQNEFI